MKKKILIVILIIVLIFAYQFAVKEANKIFPLNVEEFDAITGYCLYGNGEADPRVATVRYNQQEEMTIIADLLNQLELEPQNKVTSIWPEKHELSLSVYLLEDTTWPKRTDRMIGFYFLENDTVVIEYMGQFTYYTCDYSSLLGANGYWNYIDVESDGVELKQEITLEAENITPTGVVLKCTQSGGKPTEELQTGSWYIVEYWSQGYGWKEVEHIFKGELAWTMEAWSIPANGSLSWNINWEGIYGSLPPGKYRVGKEITDFRTTGDYDEAVYYAEFQIK